MKHLPGLFVLLSMLLFSCDDNSSIEKETIEVNPTSIKIEGNGASVPITINSSSGSWSISSDAEWCETSETEGTTKVGIVRVSAKPNLTFEERRAVVTISAPNSDDVEVEVSQGIPNDLDLIIITEKELLISSEEG